MAEVYALFSARDGQVRYVGKTTDTRHFRFKYHQRSQHGKNVSNAYQWMHDEWRAGYPVKPALLERCSYETLDDAETKWIRKFPNLLNERKRRYGSHLIKPPTILEIRNYMRRFIFNSGGYRGVHYCRQIDRYCVFVYRGPKTEEWVLGDGAPGMSGDIWFSDRIEAVKARDEFRKRRPHLDWLPDIVALNEA